MRLVLRYENMIQSLNMTYQFSGNDEPSDEQLLAIMKEVQADVVRKNKERKSKIMDNLQKEYQKVRAMFPNL